MAPAVASPQPQRRHAVLFPFMSKGHTIPLLHLARLLLSRRLAAVTLITTPANRPFIAASLSGTPASVLDIPFPRHAPFLPAGVETTDHLPSISLFFRLATATALMRPDFERALRALRPRPTFIVSDGFLGWTQASAAALGIPRFVFYGMSNYAMTVSRELAVHGGRIVSPSSGEDEPFVIPSLPWITLTLNDFEPEFRGGGGGGPLIDFIIEQGIATERSRGIIANSFYELEAVFVDHWNHRYQPKACCVGPLCLADPGRPCDDAPPYLRWLDRKLADGKSVLYVAFGSQAEISGEESAEIAAGLEESGVNYLWAARSSGDGWRRSGWEEQSEGRGLVVRGWVEQRAVLGHRSVEGFVSHCGWNSVTDALSAGVPVAAWPMMAEQHLNARMVVEELKAGLRVETRSGSVRGFVGREGLAAAAREVMEGERGKEARRRAREVAEMAAKAVAEGGSSWRALERLVEDACGEGVEAAEC